MTYQERFDLFLKRTGQVLLESIIAIVVFIALVAGVFSFFIWYKQDMAKREAAYVSTHSFSGQTGLPENFYESEAADII